MPRVQHDQAHALEHALLHAIHDFVTYLIVRHVAPPGQHVGRRQPLHDQPVLRLLQRGRRDRGARQQPADALGDGRMHAARVDRADLGILVLVDVFAPDGDSEWLHKSNGYKWQIQKNLSKTFRWPIPPNTPSPTACAPWPLASGRRSGWSASDRVRSATPSCWGCCCAAARAARM